MGYEDGVAWERTRKGSSFLTSSCVRHRKVCGIANAQVGRRAAAVTSERSGLETPTHTVKERIGLTVVRIARTEDTKETVASVAGTTGAPFSGSAEWNLLLQQQSDEKGEK